MAINEIVLVAYRNGHGHVVIRWGHGLLRRIREGKETRAKKKKKIRLDTSDFGKGNAPKTKVFDRGQDQKRDKWTARNRNQHMREWQEGCRKEGEGKGSLAAGRTAQNI